MSMFFTGIMITYMGILILNLIILGEIVQKIRGSKLAPTRVLYPLLIVIFTCVGLCWKHNHEIYTGLFLLCHVTPAIRLCLMIPTIVKNLKDGVRIKPIKIFYATILALWSLFIALEVYTMFDLISKFRLD